MGDLPSLHSCITMQAENERITAKYKRLKARYTALVNQQETQPRQDPLIARRATSTSDATSQTCLSGEVSSGEERQNARLLTSHAALVRKYERELSINTEHSETISNLKIAHTKLENQLQGTREKHHKSTIALEKYRSQTEKKLDTNKEDIFKLTADRDSIRYEYEKLKSEMRGIDKNFFDEIEDLKYALQESAKLNKIYEKALQSVCRKHKVNYQQALLQVVNKHKTHS